MNDKKWRILGVAILIPLLLWTLRAWQNAGNVSAHIQAGVVTSEPITRVLEITKSPSSEINVDLWRGHQEEILIGVREDDVAYVAEYNG